MVLQGKLKALETYTRIGNFAGSFMTTPDVRVIEPKDIFSSGGEISEEKDWTVLVYQEGRDGLAYSSNFNLNKMEHLGSDDNVNVVVQTTLEPTIKERFAPAMEKANTRRYYITKDNNPEKINSPVVGELGEKVHLNSETLSDFLSWGIKNFPAKHYMVIVKKHGAGFAKTDTVPLSAKELGEALEKTGKETGKKVDILSFDSCSMEQMEVAYEIKDYAQVMTASQENVYSVDYPYDLLLWGLKDKAKTITVKEVGELVVKAHKASVPYGIQTAIDLEKLKDAGDATRKLVDAIINEKIPPEVIYPEMLKTSSMEPGDTMKLAFNFRDERGFLDNIINNKNISSESVKERAKELKEKLSDAVIAHHIGERKKLLKNGTGFNIFLPWKKPKKEIHDSYEELAFARDTSWMKLIDYIFQSKDVATSFAKDLSSEGPVEKLSVTQKLGKAVIQNYKEYVSPYLGGVGGACKHTPSCSQYGREAIEKFGLLEGGKMAFMRILSCNGEAEERFDPVPDVPEDGSEVKCNRELGPPPPDYKDNNLPDVTIKPPESVESSNFGKIIKECLIQSSRIAGKILGGIAGAVGCIPIGLVVGAKVGTKAGTNTLEQFNKELSDKYHRDAVKEFVKMEGFISITPGKVYELVKNVTSSETAAKVIGGTVGAVTGVISGAVGSAAIGFAVGSKFTGLFARNYIKDKLGELPKHPATEQILQNYYKS